LGTPSATETAELRGCLRPHHPQLARRVRCGTRRGQRRQQVGPRAASPGPDQQVHRRQRERRRRGHRPDDG